MPTKPHPKTGKEALFLLRKICKEEGIRIFWYRPLAVGMYQQLKARLGDRMLSGDIFKALRQHCNSHAYLVQLTEGAQRFDINGKVSGVVTPDEAKVAKKQRNKLHRKLLRGGGRGRGPNKSAPPAPAAPAEGKPHPDRPKNTLSRPKGNGTSPSVVVIKKKKKIELPDKG